MQVQAFMWKENNTQRKYGYEIRHLVIFGKTADCIPFQGSGNEPLSGFKNNINYFAVTFEKEMHTQANPAFNWRTLLQSMQRGNRQALARMISLVENETPGYSNVLEEMKLLSSPSIIGITGPPGSGKSSLVDGLIGILVGEGKKVGILCVDPSSPFHSGALLGDRIRMSEWYTHPSVFIRSLTTRGSLGGLHPKMIEISDLLKAACFDYILVETVGVGQSEVEIAGLADTTLVVLVPESGDDVQIMKAGLMEIADLFVVNKSDLPGAEDLVRNLLTLLAPNFHHGGCEIPVVQTVASQKKGISELMEKIRVHQRTQGHLERRSVLLAEKAFQLILYARSKDVNKWELRKSIEIEMGNPNFNLYRFVSEYGGA
jgi:LAO/AO transport system kinase